ncbi:Ig-like domain-containing domain [Clostridium sp. DL1XJH146]
MKNMKKKVSMVLGVALLLNLFTLTIFAEEKKALGLEASSIKNEEEVSLDTKEITLEFSNNVINMAVKDDNMKCFDIVDGAGNSIDFEVVMGDDQIEPEKKRIITLELQEELKAGESYKVIISSEVTAKNGNALGEDVEINFSAEAGSSQLYLFIILAVVVIGIILFAINSKKKNSNKN